jgi:hypothetical protein
VLLRVLRLCCCCYRLNISKQPEINKNLLAKTPLELLTKTPLVLPPKFFDEPEIKKNLLTKTPLVGLPRIFNRHISFSDLTTNQTTK